jgi:hypothetical protein
MRYRVPTEQTRREIESEFRKWRKDSWQDSEVSDYEIPLRLERSQTNAFVRFVLRGIPITVECSSQGSYQDNLRCIFYAVEAMRMNEKRGIADTMKNAYLQLSAPARGRDPYEVLGVRPDASMEIVKAAYRTLAKRHHPDVGGKAADMEEIEKAHNAIIEERGRAPQ